MAENTIDQMQDVFPVSFEFVKGEQPSATKLTGWVKQTNTGFARMTKAVGDPWEYTSHSGTSGSYLLSPERLAQASLSRMIGPSDYVSPRGASFQEPINTPLTVVLPSYRNTWNLGFPLVSLTSDVLPSDAGMDTVSKLTWGVDITVGLGPAFYFLNEVASPDLVDSYGDFYVDYYAGSITGYSQANSVINLQISNIHMLGPGVPWGTSNIIPHWNTDATLCWVTETASGGGTSIYTVALPQANARSRETDPDSNILGAVLHGDISVGDQVQWGTYTSGETAEYRLPISLTSNLTTGDQIPEGFMYIWDNDTSRIMPQTECYYVDENTVEVHTPEGWLTEGGTVRVIVTGTSLAEAVHYLMTVQREGRHVGLSTGQHQDTIHYTPPISHSSLADSYTGEIPSTTTEPTKYYFRESSYPVNPHPQYMHRAGYMDDDEDGNSANAMRGYLVFAGVYDGSYDLGAGDDSGTMSSTYGIMFGGGTASGLSRNASLSWEGGVNVATWGGSGYTADRLGFGIDELAAQRMGDERYGALTYTPWYGMPLYIRGAIGRGNDSYIGGVLGFDMGRRNELNYMKLEVAYRDGSYDEPNQACRINQSSVTALDITPGLTASSVCNRLAAEQVREFRFRGGSYNADALNANDGLGGTDAAQTFDETLSHDAIMADSTPGYYGVDGECAVDFRIGDEITNSGFSSSTNNGTKTITAVYQSGGDTYIYVAETVVDESSPSGALVKSEANEFNAYFTSPGMVGADFINVYSNAIFFSDTGSGETTSFTDRGNTWLDTGGSATYPSGIYYVPQDTDGPYFTLSGYDSSLGVSSQALAVGDRYGFWYTSHKSGPAAFMNYDSSIILASGFDSSDLEDRISTVRSLSDGGQIAIACGDNAVAYGVAALASSSIGLTLYTSGDYPDIRMTAWNGDIAIRTYTSGSIAIDSTEGLDLYSDTTLDLSAGGKLLLRNMTHPYSATLSSADVGMAVENTFYGEAEGGWRWHSREWGASGQDESLMYLLRSAFQVEVEDGSSSDDATLYLTPSTFTVNTDGNMSLNCSGGNLLLNPSSDDNMIILSTYVKDTSGDPSGSFSEGSIYINSADGRLKMYITSDTADKWVTLATWTP